MLDWLDRFSTLDIALIAVISVIAALILRRWHALAWTVIAALAADFALPLAYFLATGEGWDRAWAGAAGRFVYNEGGVLILRTVVYFGLIAALFAIKVAWRKR